MKRLSRRVACSNGICQTQSPLLRIYVKEFMTGFVQRGSCGAGASGQTVGPIARVGVRCVQKAWCAWGPPCMLFPSCHDAWRPRKTSMSRTPIGRTRTAWRQRPPPLRWPHSGRAALVRGMHVSPFRCPAVHPTLLPLAASSSCVTSSNFATAGDIRLSKCTSCSASRTIPGAAHTSKALR